MYLSSLKSWGYLMVEVSIELIGNGESTIYSVLDSIKKQTFEDYEVIYVFANVNKDSIKKLEKYNIKLVNTVEKTSLLRARYIANSFAIGNFRLLLDSTRTLEPKALELLITKYQEYDAVCIKEGVLGNGFWVNQADKLKILSDRTFLKTVGKSPAFLLPRWYRQEVLDTAFEFLKNSIDQELFDNIGYGEHHLIYNTANIKIDKIAITEETLLKHYEDSTASYIFKKYSRYGRSQKTLNLVKIKTQAKKLLSHKRPFILSNLLLEIETIPIKFLRLISFMYGYLFQK